MRCTSLLAGSLAFLVTAAAATADPPPDYPVPAIPRADEPTAKAISLEKAAEYLDGVAVNWTRVRKCGACHTNYPFLLARPALKAHPSPAEQEVRAFFEQRAANWHRAKIVEELSVDTLGVATGPGALKHRPLKAYAPRWDAEVVATAATLAMHDAWTTGKLHPITRQALDRMWPLIKEDGTWSWLKCDWPPYEHDDYYGAVLGALGAGLAPDGYAKTKKAQAGLKKLRAYLKKNKAPDLHHKAHLLWASRHVDGLMTAKQRQATIKQLLAKQQADGGWSLPSLAPNWERKDGTPNDPDAPSDGYGTGVIVFILRQAGVPASHPALKKGVAWLKGNQRESGRWYTRSVNNDRFHYITNAGTSFAILALKSCNALPDKSARRKSVASRPQAGPQAPR